MANATAKAPEREVVKKAPKKRAKAARKPPDERFKVPFFRGDKEWMIRQCMTKPARKNLYELIEPLLDKKTRERIGLRINLPIYVQDPAVARKYPELAPRAVLESKSPVFIGWEPGFADGPTSARLAVVDYNADTETLVEPARWDFKKWAFTDPEGIAISPDEPHSSHFHQVNVWATVQSIIEFFEDPWVLGRPLSWAFPGNRLILVPHAGWGANAFYDRRSKSLQFYCYGSPDEPLYTCLSHDIIAHETGHAILDGIRPLYLEQTSQQTAAFHEFVADLTAILTAVRNNVARGLLAVKEKEGLAQEMTPFERSSFIAGLAQQFGQYLKKRDYLRSGINYLAMGELRGTDSPHHCSQVLTGAMYDILTRISVHLMVRERERESSWLSALNWASDRVRRIAFQALDYCPPADIQFIDYAQAVLRCYRLASRRDEQGYEELMREVFHERGLCPRTWQECREKGGCELDPEQLPDGLLHRDIEDIAGSRAGAYYFLNDNRKKLGIPPNQDVVVTDLYGTNKWDVGRRRLPREVVLVYTWREPVELDDRRLEELSGRTTSLICGGTLVFDGRGNVVSWARKHGYRNPKQGLKYQLQGESRRKTLIDRIATLSESGALGLRDPAEMNQLGLTGPPVVACEVDGLLRLEGTPQLRNSEGVEPWSTSF